MAAARAAGRGQKSGGIPRVPVCLCVKCGASFGVFRSPRSAACDARQSKARRKARIECEDSIEGKAGAGSSDRILQCCTLILPIRRLAVQSPSVAFEPAALTAPACAPSFFTLSSRPTLCRFRQIRQDPLLSSQSPQADRRPQRRPLFPCVTLGPRCSSLRRRRRRRSCHSLRRNLISSRSHLLLLRASRPPLTSSLLWPLARTRTVSLISCCRSCCGACCKKQSNDSQEQQQLREASERENKCAFVSTARKLITSEAERDWLLILFSSSLFSLSSLSSNKL